MKNKRRILVVDDNGENRLLVKRILEQENYEVIAVDSGVEAISFLEADPQIDLILLDILMPKLNGFDLLDLLQVNPRTASIKVIIFSVMDRVQDKVDAFAAGAADYIVKPFNRAELLARVEMHLKLSRMEKELAEKHNLLRTLIDSLPDLIYVKDTASRFIASNLAVAHMMGADSPDALIGKTDFDFYPRGLAEDYYEDEQALVRSGQPLQAHEEPVIDAAGNQGWILTTKVPLRDDQGNVTGLVGIGRDLTPFKQAEAARQKSEARYRELIQNANSVILRLDPQGNITFCNEFGLSFFGFPKAELVGHNIVGTIVPATDSSGRDLNGMIADMLHHPERYYLNENENVRRNGERVWVAWTNKALFDDDGHLTEFLCIGNDITERKAAEESLRKLSRAVEQSASMIVITDRHGTIEFVNPRFSATTGYSSEEAIGQNPRILKSGKHPPEFYADLWDTINRGEVWRGELLNRKKSGDLYWESATISPVKGESGKVTHFVAVKNDMTQRKHIEVELRLAKEAAEAATRAKSAFLANMSHEIRTPMNGMIGMTSVLLDTDLTPQQRDYVDIIRTSGDALLNIINDILDFSKIEAGKLELEIQPFALRKCIEEALDLVAAKAAAKGLDLAYLVDDTLPATFEGDVTRLRQILVNLLSNAVKFTETGEVVVSVAAEPAGNPAGPAEACRLKFSVRDTGIGIPPERLDRLFHSFSQVDGTITRRYGGTGLGLAICKHLSEMMGGDIWVESEPGRGSAFHFTIATKAISGQELSYLRDRHANLAGQRVLIVDDNETNRHILTHQTAAWGMVPTAVSSGSQALAMIRQATTFDLAILDLQMPEMDGLTLAAEIQRLCGPESLPLIMLSSVGQLARQERRVQFAATLVKPIKPSRLYDVLTGVITGRPRPPARVISPRPLFETPLGHIHPLRILLAEDNVINQKVALSILERIGYRADVAANGLEVLEALERQPYDVVLMDVQMPEMDGVAAARQIRQQWPPAKQPCIIALTANALSGDREKCLAAGMDHYISKPVQIEQLAAVLTRCHSHPPQVDRSASALAATAPVTPPPVAPAQNGKTGAGGPVSSRPATAAVDVAVLEAFQADLGADGPEFTAELITLFLDDAPRLLAQLQQSLSQGDIESLKRGAHTLKSNSATFGAFELSALCANLEKQAKAGSLAKADTMVAEVRQELDRTVAELRHYVGLAC